MLVSSDTILETCVRLLEGKQHFEIPYRDVAQKTGCCLADVYEKFPRPYTFVEESFKNAHKIMLQSIEDIDLAMPPQDRLFEILMAHFEALVPYRPLLKVFYQSFTLEQFTLLKGHYERLEIMLELAHLQMHGLKSILQLKGFACYYACAFKVWLQDETEDLSQTMIEVQKCLTKAHKWVGYLDNPLHFFYS
jgi:hypothetical protein